MRIFVVATAILFASSGQAAPCTEAYTIDSLLADMVAVEGSLRNGNDDEAGELARKLEAGLACTDEILPGMILGRAMRGIGAGLSVAGDAERGTKWFRSALNLESNFEYGLQDLPADHVVRQVYSDARQELEEGASATVATPLREGTTVVVDGRKVTTANVDTRAMHLVQIDGETFQSYVVDGNAFPETALPVVVAAKASKSKKGKDKKAKPPKDTTRVAQAAATGAGAAASSAGKKASAPKSDKSKPEKAPKADAKVAKADKGPKAPEEASAPEKAPKEPKADTKVAKTEKPKKPEKESKGASTSGRVAKSDKKAKEAPASADRVAKAAPSKRDKDSGPVKQDAPPVNNGSQVVTNSVIMGPQVIQRQRPKEKTPLLIGGGLVLAGGGALYALSYQGKAGLALRAREQASGDLFTSEADIDAEISRVNTLYMSAVACIAVGSGSLSWGIMVDSGITMPRIGVRF